MAGEKLNPLALIQAIITFIKTMSPFITADTILDMIENNNVNNKKVIAICTAVRTILLIPDNDEPPVV